VISEIYIVVSVAFLPGQKFESLLSLWSFQEKVAERSTKIFWQIKCFCGQVFVVPMLFPLLGNTFILTSFTNYLFVVLCMLRLRHIPLNIS